MDLSHQSITGRQFDLNRRGYDPDTVDAHLAEIATAVAAREQRIAELEQTAASLTAKVQDAKESEEALRLTLKAAAHAKEELLAVAREEAKSIEEAAAAKAEGLVAEAAARASELTESSEARVRAMEDGSRRQVDAVAKASLAESEAISGRIQELRDRLEAAEQALGALQVEAQPQIASARDALDSALETARTYVEDPEILDRLAAESVAGQMDEPTPVASAGPAEESGAEISNEQPTSRQDADSAADPESVMEGDAAPPVFIDFDSAPGAEPSKESMLEDAGSGDDDGPGSEETDAAGPRLEVVESAADISDKVDRLLEELRDVT